MSKVCVITGGANGIGRCLVESFASNGYAVAFSDVDAERGEMLAHSINSEGSECQFFHGDMANEADVQAFVKTALNRFEKVDALINNACLSKRGILSGCSWTDFSYVLSLGITAPYMLCKLFMEHLSPGASIVNIASTRAFMSQPDTESYTAAKGGISALTHALAVSLAGKARVNAVSPGWIDTGEYQASGSLADYSKGDIMQHPCRKVGEPKDIAAMCLFLCTEDAGFITGQNFTVDGGMTKQMVYHNDMGWELHT